MREKKVTKPSLLEFDGKISFGEKRDALIGLDEAGRGPLAGPVVAAAAFIPPRAAVFLCGVDDSKKLSPRAREAALKTMIAAGVKFGFGYASSAYIDERNILEASFYAMRKAARSLLGFLCPRPRAPLFLVDGNLPVRDLGYAQVPVRGGDGKSLSIAAASVFAKVIRDNWMNILDLRHPGYGFSRHKGYGTKKHVEAIRLRGHSPEHRKTFAGVKP